MCWAPPWRKAPGAVSLTQGSACGHPGVDCWRLRGPGSGIRDAKVPSWLQQGKKRAAFWPSRWSGNPIVSEEPSDLGVGSSFRPPHVLVLVNLLGALPASTVHPEGPKPHLQQKRPGSVLVPLLPRGWRRAGETMNAQPRREERLGPPSPPTAPFALESRSLTSAVGHPCHGDTMSPPSPRWDPEWWGQGHERQERGHGAGALQTGGPLPLQGGWAWGGECPDGLVP